MNADSMIEGDAITNLSGGGVFLSSEGTFTMNGGTVSGADGGGGGVAIRGVAFTMHNGEISDCTSSGAGGAGVFVFGGQFTMLDGTIKDNIHSYNSSGGGGVYGTFTMTGGTIYGTGSNNAEAGLGAAYYNARSHSASSNNTIYQYTPAPLE
jgi:hypothetical protein